MKNRSTSILAFLPVIFYSNINIAAQQTATEAKKDSGMHLTRDEKDNMPLSNYTFNSSLNATFTFTDSLNNITSKTNYTYYFDKGSDYFAIKESYECKNKSRASFLLEEIRDSIAFRANLNDSSRTLNYKRLQNNRIPGGKITSNQANQLSAYNKTGVTRMINGVLCESMVMENEQIKNTLWVTINEDVWFNKIRKDLQCLIYNELTAYMNGIVMLSECYYKQTKHTQTFQVTAINKNIDNRVTTEGTKLVGGY